MLANENRLLYHGIRNLLRCDDSEVVAGIVRYVITKHRVLRLMAPLVEQARGTIIPQWFAVLAWLRAFLSVRPPSMNAGVIWIARLSNERKAIEPFVDLAPELGWTQLKYKNWPDKRGVLDLMRLRRKRTGLRRILHIAHYLHRHHEFFKVLRIMELMAYYTRYLCIFEETQFKVAVTSSHSNPHAIAFNLAARKSEVPIVLITHGMPVRPVARLHFDLALVHCEAARQTYLDEGCAIKDVFIHGRRQNHHSMPASLPTALSAGIFLCKDVNEEMFRALTHRLLANKRISRVVVRPHPKNLWRELTTFLNSLDQKRILKVADARVWNDLDDVDLVFGGNSSVLIDAIVAGKPAVFVPNLDSGSNDIHQLVSSGLVCQFQAELNDFSSLLDFYKRATWPQTLRWFADVDDDQEKVAEQFCGRMSELAARGYSGPN